MNELKFQIIIPTIGGREKYLYWAIRTCLDQDYSNFEILVSNNGGDPNLCKVVADFHDSRIRYIETERLMPMAAHWEFAVAHAGGDVLIIIGDDDALMPNALGKVNAVFQEYKHVECVTHCPGQYYWNDYYHPDYKNKYQLTRGSGRVEVLDPKPILKAVSEFREFYGKLPFLYHGFVKRSVLAKIVDSQGVLFKRVSPDIYSDLAMANVIEFYARVDDCLTVGGQGAKSNGANFLLNNELGKQFISDLPAYLEPKYYVGNVQIQIYEDIEKVRGEFDCKDRLNVSWLRFAKQCIVEALLTPAHCQGALKALQGIVNNDFPVFYREAALALIGIFNIKLIRQIAELILQKRQRVAMGHWHDADVTCNADNIYDVIRWNCANEGR